MKKTLLFPLMACALLMSSCIAEEPLNQECDIEAISLRIDDPTTLFINAEEAEKTSISSTTNAIIFTSRPGATVGSYAFDLKMTDGAKAYIVKEEGTVEAYSATTLYDFSDEQELHIRVVSEDGEWQRNYTVRIVANKESGEETAGGSLFFDLEYSELDASNGSKYYIWPVKDESIVATGIMGDPDNNGNYIWRNGNPGFKLSKSSAKPDEYPSTPIVGENGPSHAGNACVKLETKDTGAFGNMVKMKIAAGSFFTGYFDVENALKDALKATVFGNPFKHKPTVFEFDVKFELSGEPYKDKPGKVVENITDEPDAYVVFYKNHDAEGKAVKLDGSDVLSSPLIVGKARLPHNYTADGKDLESNTPIHGLTNEWKHISLPINYTEEIDPELLNNYGYSMIIGFASSWQGAYFRGAVGTKMWIDNIKVTYE